VVEKLIAKIFFNPYGNNSSANLWLNAEFQEARESQEAPT